MALTVGRESTAGEIGRHFDDVRLLHEGSRFAVYEGVDRSSGHRVAVKTPGDAKASWLHDVLRDEGRLLAGLAGHPNVIALRREQRLDDGRPALVLERCVGTLADAVHHGSNMPLPAAVATGVQLAGALDAVHTVRWLHRDVRPDNVLLTAPGVPVLAGFDEAVSMDAATDPPPLHVTTVYTAPELLEGGEASERSDVYGLGATLYELIAGRAAYRAYAGESPAAVIVRVLSAPVRPIVAPGVPFELSDLLTWAMAANPDERPPTPAWFAEELRRIERSQGWPRTRLPG